MMPFPNTTSSPRPCFPAIVISSARASKYQGELPHVAALVVAFALAGRVDIDLSKDPIGKGKMAKRCICAKSGRLFRKSATRCNPPSSRKFFANFIAISPSRIRNGTKIPSARGNVYEWDVNSTYIQEPPFFTHFSLHQEQSPTSKAFELSASLATASPPTTSHLRQHQKDFTCWQISPRSWRRLRRLQQLRLAPRQ